MKLLVTGALRITPEESAELEKLGYEIYFMPDERVAVPDNIPCEEIEAIICNGLFLYTPPDKFPKLRTVQLTSAGLDRVPMDYMDAHGIKVFNARGVYSAPMAEFAVCSVLGFYKRSAFFSAAQSEHRWEKHRGLEELGGKRVVIVGAGSVGRACADRFRAFGCEIIGVDRKTDVDGFDKIYSISDIRAAVSAGDIVIFCLPLTKETEHIANAELLCAMKDGAVIVNISRGGIIDTDALITELKSGRLRAAARRVRAGAAGRRQRAVGSPERRDNPAQFIRRRRQPRKALFIDNKQPEIRLPPGNSTRRQFLHMPKNF